MDLEATCLRRPDRLLPHSVADRVDLLGDGCRALELQMKLARLLRGEGLPAVRALERAVQLDPDVREASVARLGASADLHSLGHLPHQPTLTEVAKMAGQT